jgi:hypothetical protein
MEAEGVGGGKKASSSGRNPFDTSINHRRKKHHKNTQTHKTNGTDGARLARESRERKTRITAHDAEPWRGSNGVKTIDSAESVPNVVRIAQAKKFYRRFEVGGSTSCKKRLDFGDESRRHVALMSKIYNRRTS